jgi:tetratricopeptide (TPR) repeat protein
MSHRLPSAGLAALILAGFGLPFAAAKPPDLPVDAKVTLKPFDPAGPSSPDQTPPAYGSGGEEQAVPAAKPAAACPAKEACDPPDPVTERNMVRCLLMAVHPLLGLVPVDELVDEIEEEDEGVAPPAPQQTGSLMLGLDLDGDIMFRIQPEADGPCFSSPNLLLWQWGWHLLQPVLDDLLGWQTWTPGLTLPSGQYLEHQPQYFPPTSPASEKAEPAPADKATGDAPEAMIELQQARKLLHMADFYRRSGHPGSACFYYLMVRMRYPDTPCAEEARRQLGKLQAEVGSKQDDSSGPSAPAPSKSVPPQDETVCPYLMEQHFGPWPQGKPIPGIFADNPESAEALYRQAMYDQKVGRLGAARACYEQICRLYPGTRHAEMAAAELKQLEGQERKQKPESDAEEQEAAPFPPKKEKCSPCKSKEQSKAVEERLQGPISLHVTETPLHQVIDDLRTATGLNIVLDTPALQNEGIDLRYPVTIQLDNVSAATALRLVLRQGRLTWTKVDGVVLVTTETHSSGAKLETRTYPVGDLLFAEDAAALRKALEQHSFKKGEVGPAPEDALVKLITRCIRCESWAEAGGAGTIDYFPLAAALVINQTPDVHERIGQLLQELRRSQQALEKAVEDQDRADPDEDQAPPDEGSEVGKPAAAASVARLLRRSHKALAAGRHEEAARLVQKALDLDAQAVAGDPLVYKLGLLHQVRRGKPTPAAKDSPRRPRPFLVPSLPPVDPGIVPALEQILVSSGAPKKELVLAVDETNGAKQEPAGAEPAALPVKQFAGGSVLISGLKCPRCNSELKKAGDEACCAVADQVRQFLCAEVDVTSEHCRARCEMHVGDYVVRLRWDGEHCDLSVGTVTAGGDR